MRSIGLILICVGLAGCNVTREAERARPGRGYSVHRGITATVFWVGEAGNVSSAWDEKWMEHFGGVDDPKRRSGWGPAGFVPRGNVFYCALPFNGGRSNCKDRWVKISRGGKVCYAQWEDVGPFVVDDEKYVFGDGTVLPRNKENHGAGIDVSPAVAGYLGIDGMGAVDWEFVEEEVVPVGPWRGE